MSALFRTDMLRSQHRNAGKQLLKEEKLLIELAMRLEKMDQHW